MSTRDDELDAIDNENITKNAHDLVSDARREVADSREEAVDDSNGETDDFSSLGNLPSASIRKGTFAGVKDESTDDSANAAAEHPINATRRPSDDHGKEEMDFGTLGEIPDAAVADNNIREIGFGEKLRKGLESETGENYSNAEAVASYMTPFVARTQRQQANEKTRALEELNDQTALDDIKSISPSEYEKRFISENEPNDRLANMVAGGNYHSAMRDYRESGSDKDALYEQGKNSQVLDIINKAGLGDSDYVKSPEFQALSADEKLAAIKPFAEQELYRQTATKQAAKDVLGSTHQRTWSKIGTGAIENTGYTLEYVVGSMLGGGGVGGFALPAAAAMSERYDDLRTNDYAIEDGKLVNKGGAYSNDDANWRAAVGGALEAGVEVGLGKAVGLIGKGALYAVGKIPGANKYLIDPVTTALRATNGAVRKIPGMKTMSYLGKQYDKVNKFTQFGEWPEELAEEDVQAFCDDVMGFGRKSNDQNYGWDDYRRDTLNWNNQREILLGMLGTMVFQGGVGAVAGAHQQNKLDKAYASLRDHEGMAGFTSKDANTARNWLVGHGVSQDDADGLSDNQAAFVANIGRRLISMTPSEREMVANEHGDKVAEMADQMIAQRSFTYDQKAMKDGRAPVKFTPETNDKGQVVWHNATRTDMDSGKQIPATVTMDRATGVAIRDNGNDYTVMDRRGNEMSADSFDQALHAAHLFAKANADLDYENTIKESQVRDIIEQMYGNSAANKFIICGTVNDLLANMRQVGSNAKNIDTLRRHIRENRDGAAVLGNGQIALILDNVDSPNDAYELVQHEAIGHHAFANKFGGKEGVVKFLRSLDAKTMKDYTAQILESHKQKILAKAAANGQKMDEATAEKLAAKEVTGDTGIQEVFAHLVQSRRHNPTIGQKLNHFVREIARKRGVSKPLNDADLEVLIDRLERDAAQKNPSDDGITVVESMTNNGITFLKTENTNSETADTDNAEGNAEEPKTTGENGDVGATDYGGFVPYKIYTDADGRRFQMDGTGQWTRESDSGDGTWEPSEKPNITNEVDAMGGGENEVPEHTNASNATSTNSTTSSAPEEQVKTVSTKPTTKFSSEASYHAKIMSQVPTSEEPIDSIAVDNELVPNVKKNADPVTGEVEPLKGDPIDLASNPIVVWETKDGKRVVATGRHRYWLYKRAGRKTIPARVIKEADGWTRNDVLVLDAMSNIIDKKGTVHDYYDFFGRISPTREQATQDRLLDTEIGRSAFSLYADASSDLQGAVNWDEPGEYAEDKIPVETAAMIANILPKDANPYHAGAQRAVVDTILKNPKMRGRKAEILARQLAYESKLRVENGDKTGNKGENYVQGDLFGADDSFMKEMAAIAEYRAKKAAGYRYDANVFSNTSGKKAKDIALKGGKAKEYGITDASDVKQIKKAYDIAKAKERYWAEGNLTDEDDAQMRKELGLPPKNGAKVEPETPETPVVPKDDPNQGDLFGGNDQQKSKLQTRADNLRKRIEELPDGKVKDYLLRRVDEFEKAVKDSKNEDMKSAINAIWCIKRKVTDVETGEVSADYESIRPTLNSTLNLFKEDGYEIVDDYVGKKADDGDAVKVVSVEKRKYLKQEEYINIYRPTIRKTDADGKTTLVQIAEVDKGVPDAGEGTNENPETNAAPKTPKAKPAPKTPEVKPEPPKPEPPKPEPPKPEPPKPEPKKSVTTSSANTPEKAANTPKNAPKSGTGKSSTTSQNPEKELPKPRADVDITAGGTLSRVDADEFGGIIDGFEEMSFATPSFADAGVDNSTKQPAAFDPDKNARNISTAIKAIQFLAGKNVKDFRSFVDLVHRALLSKGRDETWKSLKPSMYGFWMSAYGQLVATQTPIDMIFPQPAQEIVDEIDSLDANGNEKPREDGRTKWSRADMANAYFALANNEFALKHPEATKIANEMLAQGIPVSSIVQGYFTPEEIKSWKDDQSAWPVSGMLVYSADDAASIFEMLSNPYCEISKCLYMDKDHRVIEGRVLGIGDLTSTDIGYKEMTRDIPKGTAGIIISHNHPSGDVTPSGEASGQKGDMVGTSQLNNLLLVEHNIPLLDHIVTDTNKFASIRLGSDSYTKFNISIPAKQWWNRFKGEKGLQGGIKRAPMRWENVSRNDVTKIAPDAKSGFSEDFVRHFAQQLSTHNQEHSYAVCLNHHFKVSAIVRIPAAEAKDSSDLTERMKESLTRQGESLYTMLVLGSGRFDVKAISDAAQQTERKIVGIYSIPAGKSVSPLDFNMDLCGKIDRGSIRDIDLFPQPTELPKRMPKALEVERPQKFRYTTKQTGDNGNVLVTGHVGGTVDQRGNQSQTNGVAGNAAQGNSGAAGGQQGEGSAGSGLLGPNAFGPAAGMGGGVGRTLPVGGGTSSGGVNGQNGAGKGDSGANVRGNGTRSGGEGTGENGNTLGVQPDLKGSGDKAGTRVSQVLAKEQPSNQGGMEGNVAEALKDNTPRTRIERNIAALNILKGITFAVPENLPENIDRSQILGNPNRELTDDERNTIRLYTGWHGFERIFRREVKRAYNEYDAAIHTGSEDSIIDVDAAIKNALDEINSYTYAERDKVTREELETYIYLVKNLASEDFSSLEVNMNEANRNLDWEGIDNGYNTPPQIANIVHAALADAGLKGGYFLELGAGVGHVLGIGQNWYDAGNPMWTAVENDFDSAKILHLLYPKANLLVSDLHKTNIVDGFYDYVGFSAPNSTRAMKDEAFVPEKYKPLTTAQLFAAEGLDKLRIGGVMTMMMPENAINGDNNALVRYFNQHGGQVVGSFDLDNELVGEGDDKAKRVMLVVQKVDGKPNNSNKLVSANGVMTFDAPRAESEEQFASSLEKVLANVDGSRLANPNYRPEINRPRDVRDERGLTEGSTIADGDRIRVKVGNELRVASVPGGEKSIKSALAIQKAYEKLRTPVLAYLNHQLDHDLGDGRGPGYTSVYIKTREALRKAAENAYNEFVNKHKFLHDEKNLGIIMLDRADGLRVLAIEDFNKETREAKPNVILKKTNILGGSLAPQSVSTPADALNASLTYRGYIDPVYMSNILGLNERELMNSLEAAGLVFENPESRRYEERSLYLSGHVRAKIEAAKKAALIDPKYQRNIDELNKVKTPDIHFVEKNPKAAIQARAGTNWMPADIQMNFFRKANIRISRMRYSPSSGKWIIGDVMRVTPSNTAADKTPLDYDRMVKTPKKAKNSADAARKLEQAKNAQVKAMLKAMLNHTPVTIRDPGTGEVDDEATHIANAKISACHQLFSAWILKNAGARDRIADIYNRQLNDMTERDFSQYHLVLPGISPKWRGWMNAKDRSYQPSFIASCVYNGNRLAAHEVGSGKTFEMQAATMEMRRLGKARRVMHVVKKNTFEQYVNEWLDAFPGAKILAIDNEDKKFTNSDIISLVTNGDWDGVVVTHDTFGSFGLSKSVLQRRLDSINDEYAQMIADVRDAGDADAKTQINAIQQEWNREVVQINNDIKQAEKKQFVELDSLGIDQLFVDEAHNFKGIPINTSKASIRGISDTKSAKARDMLAKVRYVTGIHNGDSGVVFATGTPIKNSFGEVYVLSKYLRPDLLRSLGMQHFDGWCNAYSDTIQALMPNDAGQLEEEATIKPVNAIPMSRMFHMFADVVTRDNGRLKIKVPKIKGGKPTLHKISPSPVQDLFGQALIRMFAEDYNGPTINALKLKGMGRGIAIDPRLAAINDPGEGRIKEAAHEIVRIYKEHENDKAAQMVFLDRGVPGSAKPKIATAKVGDQKISVQIANRLKGLRDIGNGEYAIRLGNNSWDVIITKRDKSGTREIIAETTLKNGQKYTETTTYADVDANGNAPQGTPFDPVSLHIALVHFQLRLNYVKERMLDANKTRGDADHHASAAIGKGESDYGIKSSLKRVSEKGGEPVDIEGLVKDEVKRLGFDPRFKSVQSVDDFMHQEDLRGYIVDEPWKLPNEYIYSNVYNMYDALRDKLVEGGIKEDEIAYIHDAKNDQEKEEIFSAVRAGKIRVLIGSTQKMGEGTNVQKRLVALHNLDIQWTPAEMKQRIGRIIRSGNSFDEVEIHNYVTAKSMDANSWSIVSVKNRLISQVLSIPRLNVIDSIEGEQVSQEETIAAILDDARLSARAKLERMLGDARMYRDMAQSELDQSRNSIEGARKQFETKQREFLADREKFMKVANQRKAEGDKFTIVNATGERLEKSIDIFKLIHDSVQQFPPNIRAADGSLEFGSQDHEIGKVFGSPLNLEWQVWRNGDGSFSASAHLVMHDLGLVTNLSSPKFGEISLTEQDVTNLKTTVARYLNPVSDTNPMPKMLAKKEQEVRGYAENVASIEDTIKRAEESVAANEKTIQYAEPRYTAIVESLERSAKGYDESEFIKRVPELLKGDPNGDDNGPDDPDGGPDGGGGGDSFFGDATISFATPDFAARYSADTANNAAFLAENDTPFSFATPDFAKTPRDMDRKALGDGLSGIANADQDAAMTDRGLKAPQKRVRKDEEVLRGAEERESNSEYMAKLRHVLARNPRAISAEENVAMARQWLRAKDEYDDLVESHVEAINAGDEEAAKGIAKQKAIKEKELAEYVKAREAGVGEAARTLRTNRFLFAKDYSLAGLAAQRISDLGRPLTDVEFNELKEIADKLKKLDEANRDIALARIKANADRVIQDMINAAKVDAATTPRTTNEMRRMLRKRNEALAQIEILAYELGGSIDSIIPEKDGDDLTSGSKFMNLRKYLRGLAEYHVYHNPNITEQELMQQFIEDISPYFTATVHDLRQIFSGYGFSWNINRNEREKKVSDLTSQSRVLEQILSLDNGEMIKLTGPQRDEQSPIVRELMRIRDQKRRQMERDGMLPTGDNHLKTMLDSAKTRYTHMIEDIKRALDAHAKLPDRAKSNISDAELDALKAEYKLLREEYDKIWGKTPMSDEAKRNIVIKALERAMDRWMKKLDDARTGKWERNGNSGPKITGGVIDELRNKIKEVAFEVQQLRKNRTVKDISPEEIKFIVQNRLEAINNAIAHWQTAMLTGDIAPKKKSFTTRDFANDLQRRISEEKDPAKRAGLEKDLAFIKQSIEDEDYNRTQRERLYRQIIDMRAHDKNRKTPLGLGYVKEYAAFVNNMMRSLLATADFSAMMRQTSMLTTGHLPTALKTFWNTFSTMLPNGSSRAADIDRELRSDPIVREAIENGWLNWRNLEGDGSNNDVEMFHGVDAQAITVGKRKDGTERRVALGDIPILSQVLHGSERQYASFINMMSADIYKKLVNSPVWGPNGASEYQKRELASYINMANGSAQLGAKGKQAMSMLTSVLWAPKLAVSRAQLAFGADIIHPFIAGESGDAGMKDRAKVAAFIALEHAKSFAAAIAAGFLLLCLFGDDDDKYELSKAQSVMDKALLAIKPRIGSTTIDFSGGVSQWWKLLRMIVTGTKRTATGKEIDLRNTYGRSITQEIFRFAQGKLNPLASNTLALIEGRDYVGNEFGPLQLAKNTFLPLGGQDVVSAITNENNGPWRGLLMAPLILAGAGGSTYDVDRFNIAYNEFKARDAEYKDAIKHGDYTRMNQLAGEFPELRHGARLESLFNTANKTATMIKKRQKQGLPESHTLNEMLQRQQQSALAAFRSAR